ncbi:hypothetical protein EYF80_024738 [Liparis tanakae]|uniref:Uncharacterized protein n=1 Tax=Liparis tanakae TaxID=230148 RepID=A0A4Z2HGJ8_9TELE|nr:hypothetical protein EYF80_024738 [Liparis tanakae]
MSRLWTTPFHLLFSSWQPPYTTRSAANSRDKKGWKEINPKCTRRCSHPSVQTQPCVMLQRCIIHHL